MNKIIQLLIIVLIVVACDLKDNFKIKGQLPDNSINGEWIYLVPLVNAPVERVDSTVIEDGSFVFQGKVKTPEIYVIRTRPFLRLSLQELLVVKEPGEINAFVGQNSKANGTALNDSLQSWKEQKEIFEVKSKLLQQQLNVADDSQKIEIEKLQKEFATTKNAYHFNFAKNNKNNVVGQMVIRFTKASYSPEQRNELGIE